MQFFPRRKRRTENKARLDLMGDSQVGSPRIIKRSLESSHLQTVSCTGLTIDCGAIIITTVKALSADVVELADTLDLGSNAKSVQVQVLSSAPEIIHGGLPH